MQSDPAATHTRAGPQRSVVRRYVPPQHGAWAMLLLPFAVGVACTRPVWLHLPLLVAWLGGYLLSYYALLAVKTRRPSRVVAQLRLYAAVTVPAGLLVVALRPGLLRFGPAFAVLLTVNVLAARRHDDRSLGDGLASVVESCLMVPVAAVVAGGSAADVVGPALAVLAYFTGLLLYVRTMIRHRGDAAYRAASIVVHVVAATAAWVTAWPLGVLFTILLARAVALPRSGLTPKQVGLLEIGPTVTLLVQLPLLYR